MKHHINLMYYTSIWCSRVHISYSRAKLLEIFLLLIDHMVHSLSYCRVYKFDRSVQVIRLQLEASSSHSYPLQVFCCNLSDSSFFEPVS